jgi:hypothetical protein
MQKDQLLCLDPPALASIYAGKIPPPGMRPDVMLLQEYASTDDRYMAFSVCRADQLFLVQSNRTMMLVYSTS